MQGVLAPSGGPSMQPLGLTSMPASLGLRDLSFQTTMVSDCG